MKIKDVIDKIEKTIEGVEKLPDWGSSAPYLIGVRDGYKGALELLKTTKKK